MRWQFAHFHSASTFYGYVVARYLKTFGQVLIAVISDVFDRLQERRESAWIKGQASLTREVELVFGTYRCGKLFFALLAIV